MSIPFVTNWRVFILLVLKFTIQRNVYCVDFYDAWIMLHHNYFQFVGRGHKSKRLVNGLGETVSRGQHNAGKQRRLQRAERG